MEIKLEYRIENGSLIRDTYFNNLKIGSINCGGVESILGKCELFGEEYVALLKENEYMKRIAKDFEQLQQENKQLKNNWDELRKHIKDWKKNEEYCSLANIPIYKYKKNIYGEILDKMQELEGSDSNENN